MSYRRRLPVLLLAAVPLLAALPAEARGTGGGGKGARGGPGAQAEVWDLPAFAADPAALLRAAASAGGAGNSASTGSIEGGVAVLLSEARYEYDEAGREVYTYRLLYRITDASADASWSSIEEHWSPWHQERPRLRARVITPDGAVHLLDPATIAENGEAAESADMYEDGRVLRAPLPATGPGAVVEQEVQVRETAPFFAGGVVHFRVLPMTVPVRLSRLVLEAPAALPLHWITRRLPGAGPREESAAGRRRLTFVYRDLEAYEEPEPGLPPDAPRAPYVAFSTGRSWADLAQRYSAIVDQAIRGSDLSAFLRKAQANPRAPEGGSQLELIERLLARLAGEVRYTGIELGDGGLMPRPPADTLRRKFGDCKDKAVLLTALLRASDIPAYVALLNAGEDEQDVEASLPGFGSFNHAIVVVPGHPALWIDPTDPFARAGELPAADQGRWALVASPTATGLVRTPEAGAADNREQAVREIDLADLGAARVVETTRYWGETERALRAYYAAEEKTALRDNLAQYMKTTYRADALTGFESSPANDLSQPFRLRLEAAKAGRGVTDIADAAVALFPGDLLASLPDDFAPRTKAEGKTEDTSASTADGLGAANDANDVSDVSDGLGEDDGGDGDEPRQADYLFARPFQVETVYRVVPPAGFAPQSLPASRVRRFGPATLSEEYTASPEGLVTATLRFDVGKRRLTAQEFAALRAGVRVVAEDKPVLILFEQAGESHLAAGRVREALTEFSRLAAAAPKKALPRTRIARALLLGGMGEAARREAEAAVQLEPKLAIAHRTLGWVLQHDALGRRFGQGYDRKGAIAAYRRAKQLAPQDEEARADLAILLEHDAGGDRYAAGADLTAAIDEYKSLRADLRAGGMDDNLVVALLRAGRYQEMRDLLDRLETTSSRKILRLVATAALDGPDAAVRDADRRFPDPKARLEALASAAQNLMILRRYPDAAALFDRASQQSPNAAEVLSLADLLRKTRRCEDLTISADEPAGVVRRLLQLFSSGSLDAHSLAALFTRDVANELTREKDEDVRRMLEIGFAPTRKRLRSNDIPMQTAMDMGFAAFRDTVAGDEATGYRVKLVNTTNDGPRELVAFVVRNEGRYQILAFVNGLDVLGQEALRRLERGDLRASRQWLDWAYEELAGRRSDDPLAVAPFVTLWPRAKEAGAGEMRCAAAALMAEGSPAAAALPLLQACREAAEAEQRSVFDLALAHADRQLGRWADLAEVSRRLLAAAPTSDHAYGLAVLATASLERWDDMRRVAEERLERLPADQLALRTLVDVRRQQGDYDGEEALLGQLIDSGKAQAGDFNNLAWLALVRGRVNDRAIENAQRAATLSEYTSYSALHTLASLYAELGRTAEAYRIILQALGTKLDESPTSVDWYVFGRLAESYGLPDAARRYYERVEPGAAKADPTSTYQLARKRLDALGPLVPPNGTKQARAGR